MMKRKSFLPVLFSLLMLICVLFIVWYLPSVGNLRFRLEDVQKSLETSLGRERKQQAEYDRAVQDIQAAKEQLEAITPQHVEVQAARDAQVAERKELKARKEELLKQLAALLPEETAEEEASK